MDKQGLYYKNWYPQSTTGLQSDQMDRAEPFGDKETCPMGVWSETEQHRPQLMYRRHLYEHSTYDIWMMLKTSIAVIKYKVAFSRNRFIWLVQQLRTIIHKSQPNSLITFNYLDVLVSSRDLHQKKLVLSSSGS